MAKRDPNKTARNKRIETMKVQLRALLPTVLKETGLDSEASLNAKIGGKADEFIDLKNEVITSAEHYASLYLDGFKGSLSTTGWRTSFDDMYDLFAGSKAAQQYMMLFLERSYLKHYDEYSKRRPSEEEAAIWIGQNSADYGLLVTPRFAKGDWQNDRSEIRHFKPGYWTIGHVLETGFVIPGKNKRMPFADVDAYLDFFENVLVRHSKSKYQIELAEQYSAYVRAAPNPLAVPLLIPELRYEGRETKHKYRLDFTVIDPVTMQKTGFELSPWSSHGELTGTKGKTQKEINAEASANFDKEMKKHKQYYKKHGIFALIYTDADLADMGGVFADVEECLSPKEVNTQLNFHLLSSFFGP
ncbi:hypothetical protein FHS31_002331 [Sphingomonas vulcanisoli]|uniref:Topoisomerase II n=1 Tax=Sphingomonas vulcanisoli TaxID=1658060 RepID=A0ABX0TY82_9SPHN|nr:topoisomerase [Sphingomonas vulcanisoli]NIJ08710.1 hypothetical protein [Sphingomonas vulcanisoli]